jgi:hypothetical protein
MSPIFQPAQPSIWRCDDSSTFHAGATATHTKSTTSRSPDNVQAQQVDSIFANRNPFVNGRLYSRCTAPCTTLWCSLLRTTPYSQDDLNSISGSPCQEMRLTQERIAVPRRNTQISPSAPLGFGRRPTPLSPSSVENTSARFSPSQGSSPSTISESTHLVGSQQALDDLESADGTDHSLNRNLDEEYDIVQHDTVSIDWDEWEFVRSFSEFEPVSFDFREDESEGS